MVGFSNDRINCSDATILNVPVNPTDGTNKAYVDLIAAGFLFKASCYATTTANLNAVYANGAAGVGATLTNNGALAAFTTDGTSPPINSRILVQDQTSQLENGIYDLTTVGDGVTAWVLTRSTDYDQPAEIQPGDVVPVVNGTLYHDTVWIETDTVAAVGVDPIVFIQFHIGNLPALTDGQLFIGSTGNPPVANGLTAGANITITPAAGSITIAASTGGFTWNDVVGISVTMAVDNGYVANNAGLVTLTLPLAAVFGSTFQIAGNGAGGFLIAQNAGQTIHFNGLSTTTGAAGSLSSTTRYDAVELVCTVANTDFVVLDSSGNLTVV